MSEKCPRCGSAFVRTEERRGSPALNRAVFECGTWINGQSRIERSEACYKRMERVDHSLLLPPIPGNLREVPGAQDSINEKGMREIQPRADGLYHFEDALRVWVEGDNLDPCGAGYYLSNNPSEWWEARRMTLAFIAKAKEVE